MVELADYQKKLIEMIKESYANGKKVVIVRRFGKASVMNEAAKQLKSKGKTS